MVLQPIVPLKHLCSVSANCLRPSALVNARKRFDKLDLDVMQEVSSTITQTDRLLDKGTGSLPSSAFS